MVAECREWRGECEVPCAKRSAAFPSKSAAVLFWDSVRVYGIITADMKVDDTQLLAALKREQKKPHKDISDAEKIEAANEIHEWLTGKREDVNA